MRIAVVQQDHNPGQVEKKRAKAAGYARQALASGADLILFHEELLVGCSRQGAVLSEPVDGPTTHAFLQLLQGTDAVLVYGLTKIDGPDRFISAPVLSRTGLIANYRKTHLWWNSTGLRQETAFYKPGNQLVYFELRGSKIGVMICYDSDFPEMARTYAKRVCSILLLLNNHTSRGHQDRVSAQASDNSLIFAVSCCCGLDEKGTLGGGGSNITDDQGGLVTEIWDREGIIYADLDPSTALAHREKNRGIKRDGPNYTDKAGGNIHGQTQR